MRITNLEYRMLNNERKMRVKIGNIRVRLDTWSIGTKGKNSRKLIRNKGLSKLESNWKQNRQRRSKQVLLRDGFIRIQR